MATVNTAIPIPAIRARRGTVAATAASGRVVVGVIPPLGVTSGSRARSNCSAVSQRSAGRFARHFITTSPSGAGKLGRCVLTGWGAWVT